MYLAEGGEPLRVVPPEEEVDALVGVYPQKLSDDLHGKHFGVRELRRRAALADTVALDSVIHEAEDRDDESVKIHKKKKTSVTFGAIGSTPNVGRSSLWFKPSRKLAHGVSYLGTGVHPACDSQLGSKEDLDV